MVDMKTLKNINIKKLEDLEKLSTNILIGYPTGKATINGVDSAELARVLVEGGKGASGQGWDFLRDGIKSGETEIKKALNLYVNKKIKASDVGRLAADKVKEFVKSGQYAMTLPNEKRYLRMKMKKHAEDRPLIVTEKFIDNCTYRIVKG